MYIIAGCIGFIYLRNISIMVKFFIIASGYNCKDLAVDCYQSLLLLKYDNWQAVLIDDASTDGTDLSLQRTYAMYPDERVSMVRNVENMGAACNRLAAINSFKLDKEEVIVFLGLDDRLLPNALDVIKAQYDAGKWMTYGNWINQHGIGLPKDFDLYFDEETHKNRDYRKVKYRSTAPNTFKKFLFDEIPVEDFKIDGKWIDSTTESEVMFSCLEMSGKDRIGVIEEPIYVYNQNLPGGTLARLGADYKYKIYNEIIKRPKKGILKMGVEFNNGTRIEI